MSNRKPADPQQPENAQDEDAIAFAQGIFDLARNGGAMLLAPLLEAGVPVNMSTSEGDTLLLLAAQNGHLETVRLLLSRGAEPDRQDAQQHTPLMLAAIGNHSAVIDALLEVGADTRITNDEGKTAQDIARAYQSENALRILQQAE